MPSHALQGGTLPATRHRVVCWPAEQQRLSLILGMYGADSQPLDPAGFRAKVCGVAPAAEGLGSVTCRESRLQKLYLDPDVRNQPGQQEGEATATQSTEEGALPPLAPPPVPPTRGPPRLPSRGASFK